MISTFLLLFMVILFLYAFVSTIKPKKFPPGPTWYPYIGSSGILQRMSKKYGSDWRACLELSRQYSTNILGLKTSTELLVVVFGEKNVRQVFYDKEFDARPDNFFARLRCLGNKNMGITFANGEIWKIHRQFAVKNLKQVGYGKTVMEKEIQNELSRLLNRLEESNSKPLDFVVSLSESVMNVLWKYVAGPIWYPYIGSTGILQRMSKKYGSDWRACIELSRQYSTNILGMKTSTELLVVVFGEKNVRQVFNDKEFDARPDNFFARLRCLGNKNMGITFANGEIWKIHRKFALRNLKQVGYGKTVMEKEIQNELSRLLNHLKKSNSKPLDFVVSLSESVMNVLWKYVAGERIKEDKLNHLLDLFRQRGEAFSMAGGLLNQMPWCRFIIPKLSGYSLITKLNREISKVIEEAIEKHKNNEVEQKDFIYLFLEEIYANKDPTFTEEQLKMVCLDFIIAGSQTSSNVLGFAFLKALKCQEMQQKIYEEIDTVIGDRTPCWNDSERLVYTSAFILEVHRYYQTVPMAGPRLVQTDTSIDGYVIPKGATVLMSLGDIYFDPELWDDPHLFKPERFIDESGMLKNSEHMYHFGLGRRRCPGDSLGKSFTFITFVGILQKYRIHVSNGTMPSDVPVIGILSAPRPYSAEFTIRE